MARGNASNKIAVAGRTSSLGSGAKVQGGTRTQIPVGASPRIKGVRDNGIQGGTNTLRPGAGDKGASGLMVMPKSIRNSSFAPQAGSRGDSKAPRTSDHSPEA